MGDYAEGWNDKNHPAQWGVAEWPRSHASEGDKRGRPSFWDLTMPIVLIGALGTSGAALVRELGRRLLRRCRR